MAVTHYKSRLGLLRGWGTDLLCDAKHYGRVLPPNLIEIILNNNLMNERWFINRCCRIFAPLLQLLLLLYTLHLSCKPLTFAVCVINPARGMYKFFSGFPQ